MLKTIIEKKKKKKPDAWNASAFFIYFLLLLFKLKRLIQNPKVELKRFWVGLDSGTK